MQKTYEDLLQQYQLRVALNELRICDRESAEILVLKNRPDVMRLLRSSIGVSLATFYQHQVWELREARESAAKFLFKFLSKPEPEKKHDFAIECPPYRDRKPKDRSIYLDVTATLRGHTAGGIKRVATQLSKAALRSGLAVPVYLKGGQLWEVHRDMDASIPLTLKKNDIYTIMDEFWSLPDEHLNALAAANKSGAKTALCLHDIFPVELPLLVNPDYADTFAALLPQFISTVDICMGVSKVTEKDIRAYIERTIKGIERRPKTSSFNIGSDAFDINIEEPRAEVAELFSRERTFFSVGTVEPKKGYDVTLDAFDLLWQKGVDVRYVVFGRYGWNAKALKSRITSHPKYGTQLHWLEDGSDADISYAYSRGAALIQSSVAEGFGLPIIEAESYGIPIIASDILIFREINPGRCTFFEVCDFLKLADIIDSISNQRSDAAPLSKRTRSWDDSLVSLINSLLTLTSNMGASSREESSI
jgi:glycosyltransferase involved in cell wall biosynthesis